MKEDSNKTHVQNYAVKEERIINEEAYTERNYPKMFESKIFQTHDKTSDDKRSDGKSKFEEQVCDIKDKKQENWTRIN